MKVAILAESPADEAAIRILVEALLARTTEPLTDSVLRARTWPGLRTELGLVYRHLLYRTDADALVVVADSNHSPIPLPNRRDRAQPQPEGRMQELLAELDKARAKSVPGRKPLHVAIGLAVPAIEAWWRCGIDHGVNEARWRDGLSGQPVGYTKISLKTAVYGTENPSLSHATDKMTEHARRLSSRLDLLKENFPFGFGHLAQQVCAW